MKEELADECDYSREASFMRMFGSPSFLGSDPHFKVPWVWEGSTDRVLVMQHVDGVSVGGQLADKLSQRDRDVVSVRTRSPSESTASMFVLHADRRSHH